MDPPAARVLIVDDEVDIREALSWYLEDALADADVEIRTSPSCEEGAAHLDTQRRLVIVCDYNLGPRAMNGLDFFAQVRAGRPDARLVLMSGYGIQDLVRANLASIDAFLPKPFDAPDLLRAVRPALETTEHDITTERPGAVP